MSEKLHVALSFIVRKPNSNMFLLLDRDCVRKTYAKFGIERFYRGVFVNIVRMAPNTAIQFGSYELLKQFTSGYF